MAQNKYSRRQILKAILGASLAQGCNNGNRAVVGPLDFISLPKENLFWEDLEVIHNDLENDFSFNFTTISQNGLKFKGLVKSGEEYLALEAKGFQFEVELDQNVKNYTIEELKWRKDGFSLSLREGDNHFVSCFDSGKDLHFSGLEHTLNLATREKKINANYYNGSIQEDAYFRIDASLEKDGIILRKADKTRVSDSSPGNNLLIKEPYFHFVQLRSPTSFEIENKIKERNKPIPEVKDSIGIGLEENFSFEFFPSLEARLENLPGQGLLFLPDLINTQFEQNGVEYLIRYFALDTRKIPSNNSERIFYPANTVFTELIEAPKRIFLSENNPQLFDIEGARYTLTLKGEEESPNDFPGKSFILEVRKGDSIQEVRIKPLTYAYPNRVFDINIDPDLQPYFTDSKSLLQSFFISKNKFSSAPDFGDDHQFSGLKKVLVPNYDPTSHNKKISYEQVTLANRFNGEVQDSFFRCDIDIGIDSYRKVRSDEENDSYKIISSKGFSPADQIENGYKVKIKSLQKIISEH
ncbi:MAG: hypothetical protein Q7S27_00300 [Nanoarchaeota archaeon]|nr:hypothetical protein [Nanoarchaeota archaeon]